MGPSAKLPPSPIFCFTPMFRGSPNGLPRFRSHPARSEVHRTGVTLGDRLNLRRHPYVSHGGVFVFPSIHYVLSRYKTMSPSTQTTSEMSRTKDYLPSPLDPLTDLLDKGFPKG